MFKIVLLLHTVLHSMGEYAEALQLADLVVSEQYKLYEVKLIHIYSCIHKYLVIGEVWSIFWIS